MDVVVTGAKGMLATDLLPLLEGHRVRAYGRAELDITDYGAIKEALRAHPADVLINCAAYTDVEGAEDNRQQALLVNGVAAGRLARACKEEGVRLIHISTDFVFDGTTPRPYTEDDPTNPLSIYGKSKLQGEQEIMANTEDFIIIRTSWLYGHGGKNFARTILNRAATMEQLKVVYDQVGTPTYTKDLANAVLALVEAPAGIYHFSNEGVASWYDFAYNIIRLAEREGAELKAKTIRPILAEELTLKATRPHYSVLSKAKYRNQTALDVPHWVDGLERWLKRELKTDNAQKG